MTFRRTLMLGWGTILFESVNCSSVDCVKAPRHPTTEVDGKHLKLDALEHVPSLSVGDDVRQEIAVSLLYETYLRIANGKKVQIRRGGESSGWAKTI